MLEKAKRIKLTIENPGGVDRKAWPITQGVPFADGDLERGTPVRAVSPDGKALPTQTTCLATWNRDLKYVKWLLVDFQADLGVDETREVYLEYGEGIESPEPVQEVRVEDSGEGVTIDTGALRLNVRKGSPDFLARCELRTEDGWQDVLRGNPGPYLYMRNRSGEVYDSVTAAPDPRVVVEDWGPVRASVCIKGYHATPDGICLCPYTVRIHAYAGSRDLRMFHTFVFDQNPDVLEFSEVGMYFPLDLGDELRMAYGGEEKAHWAVRWERAEYLQSSDIAYEVTRDNEPFGKGEKTRGWASLCGSEASAFVAIRDFWQQYPKGYELTREGINVQFWPASYGEPMAFHTPWKEDMVFFNGWRGDPATLASDRDEAAFKLLLGKYPTAPLNLKSIGPKTPQDALWVKEMVEKYAPNRTASFNDTGTSDGTGAGKTHEVLIRFSSEPISDEEAEGLGICVQEPVMAPADPAYMGRTRATRDVHGGQDPRFEELDALLDGITERVAIEPMERARLWGFWRFGNMCCSHATGAPLTYLAHYDRADLVEAMKRFVGPYNNEADDPCWGLWTQFLRTGNRRFFLAACGHSRAMGEVGICHANPGRPDAVGLVHYHNAHQWTGGYSPSHTVNTALFMHYYFTGERRLREIALEPADRAVRIQEDAGIYSNPTGTLNREFTGPLLCVIEAYLNTWGRKYGDLARRSLNWYLRTQDKPGSFPVSVYTRGDRGDEAVLEGEHQPHNYQGTLYPTYYEGLRLFESPLLRDTVMADADNAIALDKTGHPGATACAMAYEMTGDPIYAAFCNSCLESYKETSRRIVDLKPHAFSTSGEVVATGFSFSGLRNGYIAVLKTTVDRAMEKDPKAFEDAVERLKSLVGKGREKKASRPDPFKPERSLGVIEVHDV